MKIIDIQIIEFGGLENRRFTLDGGLNVFEGDNETGKSTLWLFIKFMLYGMAKKGTSERERSINRLSHRASGTMTLECDNVEYRIERSFSENSRGKVVTYRTDTGERVFADKEPGEALLGVAKDIFESSCGIGQSAASSLGGEKGAAAIRNILSSADESVDIDKIQKRLEAIRVYYRHKNGKGGKLYEMSGKINQLEQRLEKASENRMRIAEIEEKLEKNAQVTAQNEEKSEEIGAVIETARKREVLRRFDALGENRRKKASLDEQIEMHKSRHVRNGYMPAATDVANLNMVASSAERISAAVSNAKDALCEAENNIPFDRELAQKGELIEKNGGAIALNERIRKSKKIILLGITLSGIGVSFALVAAFIIFVSVVTKLPGIIIAAVDLAISAIGIAVACVWGAKNKRICREYGKKNIKELSEYIGLCAAAYEKRNEYQNSLLELNSDLVRAEEQKRIIEADLERAIRRVSQDLPVSAENARAEAERIRNFLDEYSALVRAKESICAVIENDEKILSVYDESELRAFVADSGANISDRELRDAENKRKFYDEQIRVLRQRDNNLRTELINLKATAEDPTAIADRLAELRERHAEADNYYEAVVTAIDGIERAAASLQGNITPMIGHKAAKMIEYISNGAYSAVNMGRDLNISLTDGVGLTTTEEMMSGGTKDASYLALRISLMMQIFEKELPPLMMDEVLCQLDGTRMKRIIGLIGGLCEKEMQCLLFTCHEREAEACSELGIKAKIHKM
ncbi:MAG: hypothetical protein E7607_03440 [Ruminococcaceae bacterium]|nr:hypothetical protein [Oscillospiraceae bacterium]